jgi:hypothetical protein
VSIAAIFSRRLQLITGYVRFATTFYANVWFLDRCGEQIVSHVLDKIWQGTIYSNIIQ